MTISCAIPSTGTTSTVDIFATIYFASLELITFSSIERLNENKKEVQASQGGYFSIL